MRRCRAEMWLRLEAQQTSLLGAALAHAHRKCARIDAG